MLTAACDPVFAKFPQFRGPAPRRFAVDYIGALTDFEFFGDARERDEEIAQGEFPAPDEEIYEWIDLFEAVLDAKQTFTMLELGAGWGRWGVRGYLAARSRGILDVKIGLVEGEPRHLEYLRRHLRDNGVPADCADVYEGVVSEDPGETFFYVYKMNGENSTPASWYGQFKVAPGLAPVGIAKGAYFGRDLHAFATGYAAIKVQQLQGSKIVERYPLIDLIDLDVQGEEFSVIYGAMERMNARVKRLHIGTHGREIEANLRLLLAANGWECLRDYPCNATSATPYGDIAFQDGIQTWRNPRL